MKGETDFRTKASHCSYLELVFCQKMGGRLLVGLFKKEISTSIAQISVFLLKDIKIRRIRIFKHVYIYTVPLQIYRKT